MKNNLKIDPSSQVEWTQSKVLLLIELWRKNEFLYNPKHKFYVDKQARQDAIEKICEELKEEVPNITALDVKNKMNYLRGQYSRELKKLKIKSGMNNDEVPECSLYWFPKMYFIKEYVKCRKSIIEFEERAAIEEIIIPESDSNDDSITIESTEISLPSTLPDKKRKLETVSKNDENEFLETTSAALNSKTSSASKKSKAISIDSFTTNVNAFTNYINKELLEIKDLRLQDEVKIKISNLVFQYKVKQRDLDFEYL